MRKALVSRTVESLETRTLLNASYHPLASSAFTQDWTDVSLIVANNDWADVPSITGYQGDGLSLTAGSDPRVATGGILGAVQVAANQKDLATAPAGVAEFNIPDPVVALKGSGTAIAPSLLLHLNTVGVVGTEVRFNLRDIDNTVNNTTDQFAVQYRVGATGAFQNVPGGYVVDATTGPSLGTLVTPVSVVLPPEANGQAQVQVRILTTNAPSSDEWVGIDDINVTSTPASPSGTFVFSSHDYSVNERSPAAMIRVVRTGGSSGAAMVSLSIAGGTAKSGVDYSPLLAPISFADGQTFADVMLPILNDNLLEGDETVQLALPGATVGLAGTTASLRIVEDNFADVRLNEILVNPDGIDNPFESVEIRGIPNAPLAHLYYVTLNGDFVSSAPAPIGVVNFVQDLSGYHLGASGLLVIQAASGGQAIPLATTVVANRFLQEQANLSNGSITHLLISSPTPIYWGADLDTNDDGFLDLPIGTTVEDSVGWTDGGPGDVVYSAAVLTQSSGTPDAASRFPHDLAAGSKSSWYNGDLATNTPALPSGLLYNPAKASTNFPLGAAVTPGVTNFDAAPSNSAPAATNDAYQINFGESLDLDPTQGLLANDTDADQDPLGVVLDSEPAPSAGLLTVGKDGSLLYIPAAGFSGLVSFTYHATDGQMSSQTQTVAITVLPAPNAPPVIALPTAPQTTNEDVAITFGTSATNSISIADPDSGAEDVEVTLTVNTGTLTLAGILGLSFTAGDGASDASMTFTGTVSAINEALDGLVFLPSPNAFGTATFAIAVDDLGHTGGGGPQTASGSFVMTVNSVNDTPVAVPDGPISVNEDASVIVSVLTNDTDVEGDTLTIVDVTAAPAHGTVVISADKKAITYTPSANYFGPDAFQYRITDGNSTSAAAAVSVTVVSVNDPPVAVADPLVVTAEDVPVAINVVGNDTDPEGQTLTPVISVAPLHGTTRVNANGTITYTPAPNYNGGDSFTYRASDGSSQNALSNPIVIQILVSAVNDPPVARDDATLTLEDNAATINVLANDSDPDGDSLAFGLESGPSHGSVVMLADKFVYTPSANFFGTDTFVYRLMDSGAIGSLATVTVTVAAVNDAPVLPTLADRAATEGSTLTILAPATDAEGDVLTYSLAAGFPSGTTINPATGEVRVVAADGPSDLSVTILATDPLGLSASATVKVHVTNVAPAIAALANASLEQGGRLSRSGSFADPGADTWTATIDYGDGSGAQALALNADKTFALGHTYAAAGTYAAIVRVTDRDGASAEARFSVAVAVAASPVTTVASASPFLQKRVAKGIDLAFSKALDSGTATNRATYRLVMAGKDRKFGTKDDVVVALKSATYDASKNTVRLTTRKPLNLTGTGVRLTVSGLKDAQGRTIDGNRDGLPGGDYAALFRKKAVTVLSK